jgi:hypothetical protein
MVGMSAEVGLAWSSAFRDFRKAKCLDLALRGGDGMRVHPIFLKVTKGDW